MDRDLIEAKKIEIKEFFMETLELEEFPEKWNVFLSLAYRFLKNAVKVEEDKEIVNKAQRNKVLIKLLEDAMCGCNDDFLLEDYKYYLNTGKDEHIFISSSEKMNEALIRYQDRQIEEMIESGQIWVR